ncbi:MAG: endonuclease MutS2 [Armatimonadetes bacterium]|nr:endonuclease MutS2 [Armatimonadota bacterium]
MDEKTLTALEYDKVLDLLAARCQTPIGREKALSERPRTSLEEVERLQRQTTDAKRRLETDGMPPFGGLTDPRPLLEKAVKGDLLSAEELNQLGNDLTILAAVRQFLLKSRKQDSIYLLAQSLGDHSRLLAQIRWAIDPEGQVLDRATDRLAHIRREIQTIKGHIQKQVQDLLRDPRWLKMLQEPYYTVRNGRYCFPVRAEFKGTVSGIIHDRSSSGQTLFVEPDPLVFLTNELRLLEQEEQAEVTRILRDLSNKVAKEEALLFASFEMLGRMDCLFAKAKLSQDLRAYEPKLVREPILDLRQARHPLLHFQGFVVPIDGELGDEYDVLVITGPNTGGKTVALKTIGLLCLMAQSGFHLPIAEGSKVGIFQQIIADIGDPQSLEASLSSFGGHIQTMIRLVREGGKGTLALLDELGAGTDPSEGAALAKALLLTLQQQGVKVVCTTHLTELKTFAHLQPRFANASVLFDPQTLRPTYRLVYGTPGKSYALEVARLLGLPEKVLSLAQEHRHGYEKELEKMMEALVREREALEQERNRLLSVRAELEQALQDARQQAEETAREKERILQQARKAAADLVRRIEGQAEEILRLVRRDPASASSVRSQIRQLRTEMASLKPVSPTVPSLPSEELPPGTSVRIPELDLVGTIRSVHKDGKEVQVEVQGIVLYVPKEKLQKVAPASPSPQPVPALTLTPTKLVPKEISLLGMRVSEGLEVLDRFLDQAILAGHRQVRVVHGRGTGKLRQAVHDFLRSSPFVHAFELAPVQEGGDGVTIVYLNPP